ncbi:lipocalin-like domain-containing protein [Kordia sp.]|uniref:lipocalin-like domain-containing protein n=1 Tax=Kordia sp. TaxID=1965332 RepID=UPI003B5A4549
MKHIKAIVLVVTIFSFLSFQKADSVEGKWELIKMETADGEVRESTGRWMGFLADGELQGGNTPGTINRTGTWSYNEETQELTIGSDKNLSGEGTFKVDWIDKDNMKLLIQQGRKVYLTRIKEK